MIKDWNSQPHRRSAHSVWFALFASALACLAWEIRAQSTSPQPPRALPEGTLPQDARLQPLKDLDGYFPFRPASSTAAWSERAQRVRRQLLVSLGLWPMPDKTPLRPVIHGAVDCGDYAVEKVYFESYPGFYVTGSLYRPKGKTGKLPAVLCPHGHWNNGRFYDQGQDGVRQEISQGAERFEDGGRSPLQSRCVQLVRMGCVVFFYDMIGYADSVQITQDLAHGFAKQRPEMNTTENWGLFSPQAEAHLQSVMGLQTWDSIRALDFLTGLPEVDANRVAVTGASGGGTQTFILCALDPRPAVAFPAVMVSTAMQGGCTCENASLLRIDTGNVEIAALFAPKPLGMTAADDWTKEMPAKGFPELKKHFAMMGAADHVSLKPLLHFGHNYNYVSRAAMYAWLNQHLKLGCPTPVIEEDYRRLSTAELSVWDATHPKPEGGPDFERKLLRYVTDQDQTHLQPALESLARYREVVGGAVDILIGRNLDEVGRIELKQVSLADRGSHRELVGLLLNESRHEELPVIILRPKESKQRTILWIDGKGKSALFSGGQPSPEVQQLLDAGCTVIGLDLLFQGEFLAAGETVNQTRRVKNPRESAAFTLGYNSALFAQRVDAILTAVKYAREKENQSATLAVVGLNGAGHWVAAAVAQARGAVSCAVVDTAGFRFGKLLDLRDVNFLPGGAKYWDLPGMLALAAPAKLWLSGEGDQAPDVVRRVYALANADSNVTAFKGDPAQASRTAIQWLISQ